ncbi:MAG: HAMP domain-containing protein [Actinobacteria bacterium]|nr:HAMP domain-containing protein [Actinomycetota bacterium]
MHRRSPSFRRRLVTWYAITLLVVLAGLGLALDRTLRSFLLDQLTDSLTAQARAIQQALPTDAAGLQAAAEELGADLNVRVTVIAPDGTVLADSASDPATMENHSTRPEVVEALGGRVGVASRTSATVGIAFRYVALPERDGVVVRVALPETETRERLASLRVILLVWGLAAAAVGLLGVWLIARHTMRPLEDLSQSVADISQGAVETEIPRSGIAELDHLGEAVAEMATEIDTRISDIQREQEMRDLVLSALDIGVVLIDGDDIAYANPPARTLIGKEAGRVQELHPAVLRKLISGAGADEERAAADFEAGYPARSIAAAAVWLERSGLVMLTLTDVTEARRVEALRRDFVSAASHELKTPAAAIQAGAETILTALDDDPEAVRLFAQMVCDNALRLSGIVSDLLDLSRLETQEPVRAPVSLDDLVQDEVDRLGAVSVNMSVEAAPVVVFGDRADLTLAVRNLLANAVRYTHEGGHVWVSVYARDRAAIVEVADDGVGIPSADLPRVFERFYRVDEGRSRRTGGTGLGLAIVKHVAEEHGGHVEAESVLSEGSAFRIVIPLES